MIPQILSQYSALDIHSARSGKLTKAKIWHLRSRANALPMSIPGAQKEVLAEHLLSNTSVVLF